MSSRPFYFGYFKAASMRNCVLVNVEASISRLEEVSTSMGKKIMSWSEVIMSWQVAAPSVEMMVVVVV